MCDKAFHPIDNSILVLTACDEILDANGLEYCPEIQCDYVNMGDTYSETVLYHGPTNQFILSKSWGDIVEERKKV